MYNLQWRQSCLFWGAGFFFWHFLRLNFRHYSQEREICSHFDQVLCGMDAFDIRRAELLHSTSDSRDWYLLNSKICSTTGAHYSCSTIKSLFSWWSFLLFSCKLKLSLLKKGSVNAFIRMLMKKNFRWLFQFLLVDSFYDLPERQCNDRKKFRPVRDLRHLQYLFLIRVDI